MRYRKGQQRSCGYATRMVRGVNILEAVDVVDFSMPVFSHGMNY